jgi:TusE/DsrC/DsvC family sulfur relay protein
MMVKLNLGKKDVVVDEDYFLVDFNAWDKEVGTDLAKMEGIEELTEDHWKVIIYLREYYGKFRTPPLIKKLLENTGFDLKTIYELFPSGPAKGACKVAGLPKPTGVC